MPLVDWRSACRRTQNAGRTKRRIRSALLPTSFRPWKDSHCCTVRRTRNATLMQPSGWRRSSCNSITSPTGTATGICRLGGILELYELTGKAQYGEQSIRKWERVTSQGYIWPIGGTGEGWSHGGGLKNAVGGRSITEACADSDWLRFNLKLWHCTGETVYLDVAERHVHNQYLANQAVNGGHGHRPVLVDGQGRLPASMVPRHATRPGAAACTARWDLST